MPNYDVSY